MSYFYEPGAVRWKRHTGEGDVRGYRPPASWSAFAYLLDFHPTTDKRFKQAQWWICEKYEGG